MKSRRCTLFALAAMAWGLGGCQWQQPKPATADAFAASETITLHVAPKELVQSMGRRLEPLGLSVEKVQEGSVFTGWKEYEGAIHIVRRWRERTRFRINVAPDFADPLGKSHVEVFDETQEKPSDQQPWYPNPDLRRPERSAEVLKAIEQSDGAGK